MVRYYDEKGRRVPAPRHDTIPSRGMLVGVGIAIVSIFLVISIALLVHRDREAQEMEEYEQEKAAKLVTHDSMTAIHTYDGETIRFYVMTDPDTQIQYIVNDRGGMCVREGLGDDGL